MPPTSCPARALADKRALAIAHRFVDGYAGQNPIVHDWKPAQEGGGADHEIEQARNEGGKQHQPDPPEFRIAGFVFQSLKQGAKRKDARLRSGPQNGDVIERLHGDNCHECEKHDE